MADYIRRAVDDELDDLRRSLPAIALEGLKGVGKTATAMQRAKTVHRLDDPDRRAMIEADPARVLGGVPPVLIDEWQRVPDTWDLVRRAVDDGAAPGRFLLTGSAAPVGLATHSGAGRIVTVRMRPLALFERKVESPTVSLRELFSGRRGPVEGETSVNLERYADEIVRSGLPGLRHLEGRALRMQLDSYLQRIAERDFPDMGYRVRNPALLRRWMAAYAASTSTSASYEKIRDAATGGLGDKPAKTTTQPYRDVLERLWVIDPVPAWLPTRSRLARLSSPPKHQLADPALAARLLGVDVGALLDGVPAAFAPRDGTLFGALFEALVTLCVRVAAQQAECRVHHLRTARGEREVDLIVERGDGRIVAIEVKLARKVVDADVKNLLWLREHVREDLLDSVIVTTGATAFRRRDGIAVVPAALLGP